MITQHTFNTALNEINESFRVLAERVEKLEQAGRTFSEGAKKPQKKTKSLSNVKKACNDEQSVV